MTGNHRYRPLKSRNLVQPLATPVSQNDIFAVIEPEGNIKVMAVSDNAWTKCVTHCKLKFVF